jgi:WD40 repeat protein
MTKGKIRYSPIPTWKFSTDNVAINHLCISPNDTELAVSQWDGKLNLYSSRTGRLSYSIQIGSDTTVVTCSKFHPVKTNLILSCTNTGKWGIWNIKTQGQVFSQANKENDLFSCDFSKNGNLFITAGKDATVRVYDTSTGSLKSSLSKSTPFTNHSHSMRIYSTIFHKSDDNLIFSGSWDNTVLMWDIRSSNAAMVFGGPNISGDSIDMRDNYLLTGAWRHKRPLEVWDIRTGNIIGGTEWGANEFCNIYSAKYCTGNGSIVAGGAEFSAVKVFSSDLKPIARLGVFTEAVNSVAITSDANIVVAADQAGSCQAFINASVEEEQK